MTQQLEVERSGCRLHAQVSGNGPRVVLIQGVGVHGDGWLPQVRRLGQEFCCMRIDNRGIGRSMPAGSSISVEQMTEDVGSLMDAAGWDEAHIVGHSLGGLVALELALSAPHRVKSLALLCTSASGRDLVRMTWWTMSIGLRMKVGPRRSRRRAFLEMVMPRSSLSGADHDDLAASLAPLFGYDLANQPIFAFKQAAAARSYSAENRLGELSGTPTIVMTGSHDRVALPKHGAALAARIRNARRGYPYNRRTRHCWKPCVVRSTAPWACHALGNVNEKVLPILIWLSTQIRPPWLSMIPFAMASPSPAPARRFFFACQKRSKTRDRCSGAMPDPESRTLKRTKPSSQGSATSAISPPSGVW
jgi:pimeloyl-ACP methyl ester carboxylesterase